MSMLFSFMTGVLLTAVIFPRFNGCPDAAVIAEAAVKKKNKVTTTLPGAMASAAAGAAAPAAAPARKGKGKKAAGSTTVG